MKKKMLLLLLCLVPIITSAENDTNIDIETFEVSSYNIYVSNESGAECYDEFGNKQGRVISYNTKIKSIIKEYKIADEFYVDISNMNNMNCSLLKFSDIDILSETEKTKKNNFILTSDGITYLTIASAIIVVLTATVTLILVNKKNKSNI